MRHLKKGKKFNRISSRRKSFLRNLASDLIRKEKIETTEARARAIRPLVERLVSVGKKQNLAAWRLVLRRAHNKAVADKVFYDLSPRYQNRDGGYLRIVKSAKSRKRDSAKIATIEFV